MSRVLDGKTPAIQQVDPGAGKINYISKRISVIKLNFYIMNKHIISKSSFIRGTKVPEIPLPPFFSA